MDDQELLREYVEHKSETAFAGLVSRHVDLVYSTASRMVRDATQAEDIAQSVFIELAQKPGAIRAGNALPGWLYRATRSHALNAIRADRARRQRETEAMNMAELDAQPDLAWGVIASDLDEAMGTLSKEEQNAVVLRFFKGQSWREASRALSLSEDTVQRRVVSALEKLRAHFSRQGIAVSASVLGLAITTNAVHAAPATMGAHLAAGSLAAASGAKGAGLLSAIIKTLVAKWQITTAIVTGTVIVGVGTAAVVHRSHTVNAETVRRGLVLHLGFDQEEADGRVSDDSGQGNNGVVTDAQWTSAGRRGGAYEFRADGDQIEVPNSPSLNPTNITLSAWVKSPSPDAKWRYVFDKSMGPGYNLAIVGDGHADTSRGNAHAMAGIKCIGGSFVADGRWHLLTATYDGSNYRLFVDGKCDKESSWPRLSLSNNKSLIIGRNAYSEPEIQRGSSFRGVIDDVRVYNRALSPREIEFLFNSAGS